MEQHMYIIGLGTVEDWEAGEGAFYYIEDRKSDTYLPVFTTADKVEAYIKANFDTPESFMQMLESGGLETSTMLQNNAYIVMPLTEENVAHVALTVDADYILRDIRPGSEQELIKVK